jgi:flagellar hook-associated protein 2
MGASESFLTFIHLRAARRMQVVVAQETSEGAVMPVGLSFGSPTSGQGFDVASTVNAIVSNMQAAETPYKTQLTSLQGQDAVLSNLGTLLSKVYTDVGYLTDFSGVMSAKNGSSSNTGVLNLTSAASTAIAGTHTVTVSKLAQTSSMYTTGVSGTDTLSGTISIQVGTGKAQTVNVDAKNATLAGLRAAINSAAIGVTASVVTNAGVQSLSIVSQTSGTAGQLTIDSSQLLDVSNSNAAVTFKTGQQGLDEQMMVDGVSVSSSSNTVTTAIPGVTFQLTGTSDNPVQVEITNDTASITSVMSTFVNDYNALVGAMNAQEGKDASGNPEPLLGSSLLSGLQSSLSGMLSYSQGSGIQNLYSLGLEVNQDGTLTLNTDTLGGVLNSNFQDVVGFFQNAGSFGQQFSTFLNHSGSSYSTGTIKMALKQNASVEDNLNKTIDNLERNISTQKDRLTTQLNAANQTLQRIPALLNSVDQLYAAITGYNQNR